MTKRSLFFVDTNVFVYCFDTDHPAKARKAKELVRLAVDSGRGVISYQVVQEFFNVALRKLAVPLTLAEADHFLIAVLQPLLKVHSSPSLFQEAMRTHARYKLSWYDSLIIAAALQAECGTLYSEDMQDSLHIGSLRVRNPFAP